MAEWDVIIVGAGPAGSALACRLRPQYRVLLLDRTPAGAAPGALRIGESLPGAARVLLQRFGVLDRFLADGHAERGATVAQWDQREPVWFDSLRDPNGPGWHLDRTRFDASLRAAAAEAGAALIEGCGHVRVAHHAGCWQIALEASGHPHCAPVVVDASGRGSAVSRQIGLARYTDKRLVCLYTHLRAAPDDEDRCTRLCTEAGGWWYTVRVPSRHRVLAFHLDGRDPDLRYLRAPAGLLARARRQPLIADALGGGGLYAAAPVRLCPAGSAVLDLDVLAQSAPGFFAIGDALLAFDPLSSQGLFHALASAESVARAIEAQFAGVPHTREPYIAEMKAVQARYQAHLAASYASVTLYAHQPFWSRQPLPSFQTTC